MKTFKTYLFSVILLSVILTSSCKKTAQDETYPEITFYAPANGATYNMFDSIYLSVYVSDDNSLKSVSINLTTIGNSPIQQTLSYTPTEKYLNIAFKYPLYEYHLASGYYYISITANDGYNTAIKQQQVYINASPTIRTGYYLFSDNGLQSTVNKLDTSFTSTNSKTLNGKYVGSFLSNYDQRLYVAGGINQDFQSIDVATNLVKWNVQNLGSGSPYFSSCEGDGRNVFLGFVDGRLKRYDLGAATLNNYIYPNTDYYSQYGAVHTNYYIGHYQSRSSTNKKLVIYNLNSGLSLNETPVNFKTIGIFKKSSTEAYVLGNDNSGQAQLNILNINNAGLSSPISIPTGSILCACRIDDNTIMFAHSNGSIYEYQFNTNNLIAVLTGITATAMKYNEGENYLYVSASKQLNVYSVGTFSLSLGKNYTYSDTIRDFQVIYNK